MNSKDCYDMGIIDSVSRCLRLSRDWSNERDKALARGEVGIAREAAAKLDACIQCAEEIVRMLEANIHASNYIPNNSK